MMGLITSIYRKHIKNLYSKLHGIPVLAIVYKPWRKGKNVETYCILPVGDDEYIMTRCKEIAERIRELYQSDIDKILEGED